MTFPQSLKQPLKGALGRTCRALLPGVFRGKTLIVAYHRVTRGDEAAGFEPGMYVDEAAFASQLDLLKRHFAVVSLAEFLAKPTSPEPRCVITFDDGWLDTYGRAFPQLRRAGLPATVFLTSGYVGTEERLWSDKVAYLVAQTWPAAERLWRLLSAANSQPDGNQAEFTAQLISYLKGLEEGVRAERIEQAASRLGITFPHQRLFLNWEEAAEMAPHGITFGCHSLSHRDLTQLSQAGLEEELAGPLQALKARPGFLPVLSYPYGYYDQRVLARTKAAGYEAGVTTAAGLNDARTNRFALRRVGIHQDISSTDGLLAFHILRAAFA